MGRQSWYWARLTKKYDGNGNQDHENVMITDERYQTLNADGKANTRSHDFLWNVLSCLDNGLRPAGGRWRGWRNADVSTHDGPRILSCSFACLDSWNVEVWVA
jgi:hypothetical protein